jgi:hypothetical protein
VLRSGSPVPRTAPATAKPTPSPTPVPSPTATAVGSVPQTLCIGGQVYTLASHDEFNLDSHLSITDNRIGDIGSAAWSDSFSWARENTGLDGTDDSYYPSMATVAAWGVAPVEQLEPGVGVKLNGEPVPAAHLNDTSTVCEDGTCRGHLGGLLTSPKGYANGYWEFKAKFPSTAGWWPALWLLNESGAGLYNETDVMEAWGPHALGPNFVEQTEILNAGQGPAPYARTSVPTDSTQMHTYAALITPSYVGFYIDNAAKSKQLTRSNSTAPLNPILDLESCAPTSWCAPAPPAGQSATMTVEHYRYYAPPIKSTPCAPPYDVPAIPA